MKNRGIYWRRYKIQKTLYIGQWRLSPLQLRNLGTLQSSPSHHQLPLYIFLNFTWLYEISSLSKVILVLGKARNHRAQNLGYRGVESPGWFDVLPKTAQDVRHEPTHWCDETVIHRLPRAAAFWIVWIVFWGGMFKRNTKLDADLLLYLLSHVEWDSHTVHMLTRWCPPSPLTSTVKSPLFTHVHSSPLSLAARLHLCHANHSHYINNGWTFPGRTLYFCEAVFCLFL